MTRDCGGYLVRIQAFLPVIMTGSLKVHSTTPAPTRHIAISTCFYTRLTTEKELCCTYGYKDFFDITRAREIGNSVLHGEKNNNNPATTTPAISLPCNPADKP